MLDRLEMKKKYMTSSRLNDRKGQRFKIRRKPSTMFTFETDSVLNRQVKIS